MRHILYSQTRLHILPVTGITNQIDTVVCSHGNLGDASREARFVPFHRPMNNIRKSACATKHTSSDHHWSYLSGKYLCSQFSMISLHKLIIRQPLCPVVGRRPQHVVSKLPCLVLYSAISCRSSICPGRLSTAWLVSLVVFSCHMVSKW